MTTENCLEAPAGPNSVLRRVRRNSRGCSALAGDLVAELEAYKAASSVARS